MGLFYIFVGKNKLAWSFRSCEPTKVLSVSVGIWGLLPLGFGYFFKFPLPRPHGVHGDLLVWWASLGGFKGLETSWASGGEGLKRPTEEESSSISFPVSRLF